MWVRHLGRLSWGLAFPGSPGQWQDLKPLGCDPGRRPPLGIASCLTSSSGEQRMWRNASRRIWAIWCTASHLFLCVVKAGGRPCGLCVSWWPCIPVLWVCMEPMSPELWASLLRELCLPDVISLLHPVTEMTHHHVIFTSFPCSREWGHYPPPWPLPACTISILPSQALAHLSSPPPPMS